MPFHWPQHPRFLNLSLVPLNAKSLLKQFLNTTFIFFLQSTLSQKIKFEKVKLAFPRNNCSSREGRAYPGALTLKACPPLGKSVSKQASFSTIEKTKCMCSPAWRLYVKKVGGLNKAA